MNSPSSRQNRAQFEALYIEAELRATRSEPSVPALGNIDEGRLPDRKALLAAASREVERYAVRRRYLPPALCSDGIWSILIDLFVNELQGLSVSLSGSARKWGRSEATAARQIAALIEADLVVRIFGDFDSDRVTLSLTEHARTIIKRILALGN